MPALDGDLGWTLGVVFRAYLKASSAVISEVPGQHRGYQVLTAATCDEAPSQAALGERLGIDRTVLTYLIDDLERAGYVRREPDPADRRARRIVATEAGRSAADQCADRLALAERHVLAGLSPVERTTLKELLARLATRVHAADPVGDTCAVVQDLGAAGAADGFGVH